MGDEWGTSGVYYVHYATNAPYSDEYYAAECEDLTDTTLQLLQRNHASLTALDVNFEQRFPNSVDWANEACIADSAFLRRLTITTHTKYVPSWRVGPEEEWRNGKGRELSSFCEGVARNTSIYHLEARLCGPGLPAQTLAPLIRDNDNLRTLTITGHCFRGPSGNSCKIHDVASLAAALRDRGNKKSLQKIDLKYIGMQHHVLEMELVTALGQYSDLQSLSLRGEKMNFAIRKCLKSLFQNPQCKLEELDLLACPIDTGEACALSEVLLLNKSLKKLILSNNPSYIEVAGWEALSAVWARPNSILEELYMCECVNDDECAAAIAAGLAKSSTIRVLSLGHVSHIECCISLSGWQAFFGQLRDPLPLKTLFLGGRDMCGEKGVAMVNMLARMPSLKVLDINNTAIDVAVSNLGDLLQSNMIRLTDLDLYDNWIRGDEASRLASALAQHTSLESLDLGNSNVGSEEDENTIEGSSPEWKAFFRSLEHHTSLVKLDLSCAGIDDESAIILVEALASSAVLKQLYLQDNDCSAAIFATLLQNPDSALGDLNLSRTRIDGAGTTAALADALAGNTALGTLHLTTQVGMDAFTQLLGRKESLMDTFTSNHTLHEMNGVLEGVLVNLLSINRMCNKHEAARQKILRFHFTGDNADIQVFVGMEPNVLPQALAWAGLDDAGRSLLYKLVRGMPSLVECGNAGKDVVAGKRKRG